MRSQQHTRARVMTSFFRVSASALRWTRCPSLVRHKSQSAANIAAFDISDPFAHLSDPGTVTFEDAGVRQPVVQALQAAFPNVRLPTESQCEFIPLILSGRDVLLKDATGTGK
jgi:hypothetical protein